MSESANLSDGGNNISTPEKTTVSNQGRRAGCCRVHVDLAWQYDDGSIQCMYCLVVETSSSDCVFGVMPTAWRHAQRRSRNA